MNDPRPVYGVIIRRSGTSPGPASGISYTIVVSDPATAGAFEMNEQKPLYRWPDELDTVATPNGIPVPGLMLGGEVTWHWMEQPAFAECSSGVAAQQRAALLRGEIDRLASGFEVVQGLPTNPEAGLPPEVPD